MKIYFAFRSGYEKTSRYVKVFEANSVLDWFQTNWNSFQEEYSCENEILGVHVYGFPIEDEELEEGQKVKPPKSISQLKSLIEEYIYSNEIKANTNCIQVLTDDDEIELAWYVFDEIYAEKYPDKVDIWFNEYLPQNFGSNGKILKKKCNLVLPKGNKKGCIYYGSSSYYDGGNIESLEGLYKIDNIRLPDILDYLRTKDIKLKEETEFCYGLDELKLMQYVAKQLPKAGIAEIFNILQQIPLTEFDRGDIDIKDIDEHTLTDVLKSQNSKKIVSENSFMKISEHCYEWNTIGMDTFHNYFVLFDDLWVEKNETLANSLQQYMRDWKI